MPAFEVEILGRTLWQWVLSLSIGALIVVVAFAAKGFVVRKQSNGVFRIIVEDLRWIVVFAWALNFAVAGLDLPPKVDLYIERAVTLLTFYQVWRWASRGLTLWIERVLMERAQQDRSMAATLGLMGFAARIAVFVLIAMLALHNMGFNITALIAGLGVGGVAIALAVQNILGDLFASLTIVLDKPFVVGDTINVGDMTGEVESVGLKTTRLRAPGGEQISVPNNNLLQSRIHNMGRLNRRRMLVNLALAASTPTEKLEALPAKLKAIVEAQGGNAARFERLQFMKFMDSALAFEGVYWLEATAPANEIQHAVNLRFHKALTDDGIALAAPVLAVRAP